MPQRNPHGVSSKVNFPSSEVLPESNANSASSAVRMAREPDTAHERAVHTRTIVLPGFSTLSSVYEVAAPYTSDAGMPRVPADDLHGPVGKVSELVLEKVECWKELAVISGELFAQFAAQGVAVGCQRIYP